MDLTRQSLFSLPLERHQSFAMNGRSAQSSGLPVVDSRSRHIGLDMSSGRPHYPVPGSGQIHGFGEIPGLGSGQLYQFLTSRDGPWVPQVSGVRAQPASEPLRGPSFFVHRNSPLPSDCGTAVGVDILPSDSGYESMTRQSVGNPSVVGEHDQSSESIITAFSGFQLQGTNRSLSEYQRDRWTQPASVRLGGTATTPNSANYVCPHCNTAVKTRSELNKHEARHTRPHRCTEPGCARKDGFGTQNDLDRHRKSVHGTNGIKFSCPLDQCARKSKLWPRADNFRQHLKRVHSLPIDSDVDLEKYKVQSPNSEDPVLTSVGVAPEQNLASNSCDVGFEAWGGSEVSEDMSENSDADGGDPFAAESDLQLPSNDSSLRRPDFGGSTTTNTGQPQDADEPEPLGVLPQDDLRDSVIPIDNLEEQVQEAVTPSPRESCGSDSPDFRPEQLDRDAMVLTTTLVARVPDSEPTEVAVLDDEDAMAIDSDDSQAALSPHDQLAMASELDRASLRIRPRRDTEGDTKLTDGEPLLDNNGDSDSESQRSGNRGGPGPLGKPKSAIDAIEMLGLTNEAMASAFIKNLEDKGLLEKLMHELGYEKTKEPLVEAKKPAAEQPSSSKNKVRCHECNKTFNRNCELKKHMKRHDKPYGCTYPNCQKSFGSKNDWKRHESSQHFKLENWSCDVCNKVCHRRETFKHHLKKDHGIEDRKVMEEKLERGRTGPKYERTRFWCGFCLQIIETNQKGLDAWKERYNHIDDHLSGRKCKKDKSDWKSDEQDLSDVPEGDVCVAGSDDGEADAPSESGGPNAAAIDKADEIATPSDAPVHSRKRPGEEIRHSSKRPRHERSRLFWVCCECSHVLPENADSCFNCLMTHMRCRSCCVEYLIVSEENYENAQDTKTAR